MATFGERLADLRKEKGLSQAGFASLFKLGQSTIGMYETNKREPDTATIKRFADFFGVTVDYLLGRSNRRKTPEMQIEEDISGDPELLQFWRELKKRDDLQLLFKQVKPLPTEAIMRIIKYIKMVEDEEAREN